MKIRFLALACSMLGLSPAPVLAQPMNEVVDPLRCRILYPLRAGFLRGSDPENYDPVHASELTAIGFTFSLYAIEESDRRGESTEEFEARADALLEKVQDLTLKRALQGEAENFFKEEFARCASLRDADPEGFAERRANAEVFFAPRIEEVLRDE